MPLSGQEKKPIDVLSLKKFRKKNENEYYSEKSTEYIAMPWTQPWPTKIGEAKIKELRKKILRQP